jgi:hypothetical protein
MVEIKVFECEGYESETHQNLETGAGGRDSVSCGIRYHDSQLDHASRSRAGN